MVHEGGGALGVGVRVALLLERTDAQLALLRALALQRALGRVEPLARLGLLALARSQPRAEPRLLEARRLQLAPRALGLGHLVAEASCAKAAVAA